jgi:hypothetical protein
MKPNVQWEPVRVSVTNIQNILRHDRLLCCAISYKSQYVTVFEIW